MSGSEGSAGMVEHGPAGTEQRPTWAGLEPDEHARRVASRARENARKVPAEHREDVQRYRLRVVDDDVYSEEQWRFEDSRFKDPDAAAEHARECYRGEYLAGLYEIEPVYLRYSGDREQTVPFGEPLVDVPEEDGPEPQPDDSDPFDDGTIGYDYYGPSWPLREI